MVNKFHYCTNNYYADLISIRKFYLQLSYLSKLNIDVPEAPTNFTVTLCDSDDHSIELNWIASVATMNSSGEIEDYILEQSINGEEFQLVRKLITHTQKCHSKINSYTYMHRVSCALFQENCLIIMPTY